MLATCFPYICVYLALKVRNPVTILESERHKAPSCGGGDRVNGTLWCVAMPKTLKKAVVLPKPYHVLLSFWVFSQIGNLTKKYSANCIQICLFPIDACGSHPFPLDACGIIGLRWFSRTHVMKPLIFQHVDNSIWFRLGSIVSCTNSGLNSYSSLLKRLSQWNEKFPMFVHFPLVLCLSISILTM